MGFGLDAAHAAGLVHRDVKPANVLMAGEPGTGHVYLTDFGLTLDASSATRVTSTGDLLGTVDYMAPEQLEGEPVSPRTDVYALGCVLHAALTGRPPFRRDTYPATMFAHMNAPAPRPSETHGVPPAFDTVIERALAKKPEDRYPTALALVDAVNAATADGAAGTVPPGRRDANGAADAPTAHLTAGTVAIPAEPTARITRTRGRRLPVAVAIAATALGAAAIGALLVFDAQVNSDAVSAAEVRVAADRFAAAYAQEDAPALRDVLTRDVSRVTPADSQRGRAAVLREYRGQFEANATEDYRITGLVVSGGAAGRATGAYVAPRTGAGPLTGRIVLGVRRDGGQPRVGLIAVTPDG